MRTCMRTPIVGQAPKVYLVVHHATKLMGEAPFSLILQLMRLQENGKRGICNSRDILFFEQSEILIQDSDEIMVLFPVNT